MTKNRIAARHAKDVRRRAQVAEKKRQDAFAASPAGRIAAAARQPIQHCLIMDSWDRIGVGHIWVARGDTPHEMTVVLFMLDTVTFGVKDAFMREWTGAEFARARANLPIEGAMVDIPPADARKLLRDAARWFQAKGIAPHRDYATLERIFGDVDTTASTFTCEFGVSPPAFQALIDAAEPSDVEDETVIEGEAVEVPADPQDASKA